jgi:hypothetical protein
LRAQVPSQYSVLHTSYRGHYNMLRRNTLRSTRHRLSTRHEPADPSTPNHAKPPTPTKTLLLAPALYNDAVLIGATRVLLAPAWPEARTPHTQHTHKECTSTHTMHTQATAPTQPCNPQSRHTYHSLLKHSSKHVSTESRHSRVINPPPRRCHSHSSTGNSPNTSPYRPSSCASTRSSAPSR